MSNSNSVKKFLGTKEASEFLGVALSTVYHLVHFKKIRYYKRGKRVYFRYEDLENYILSGEVLPLSELQQQAQNL